MPEFITRIELHKSASESDYDKLHALMKLSGFKQTIPANDGFEYKLPTAEYYYNGETTKIIVMNYAEACATKTGLSNWIVATQSAGIQIKLERAKP